MLRSKLAQLLILPALLALPALAQSQAATPPMGWNSWNHFQDKVNDAVIRAAADAMVSSGMKEAGYTYINIDDTWEGKRDAAGVIHSNEKFPDMKALADYVHSKGLKLGIYSSPGPKTCGGFEGSFDHEALDAKTYAEWGIDYLKYDLCSFGDDVMAHASSPEEAHKMMLDAYAKMSKALQATGRPIVLSLCQYGMQEVWKWRPSVGGNAWRTTGDISDSYARMTEIGFSQAGLAKYASPGHWNDPDMLEVGNGGMTIDEYRTHMSLWALLAAPLLAGNDMSTMTPETIALLTNREVIAIDQDPAGMQGDRVWAEGPFEVWARPLKNGAKAVGIFNRRESWMSKAAWMGTANVEIDFAKLGFKHPVKVRDVWASKDLGLFQSSAKAAVPVHGVVLWIVSEK